MIRHFFAACGLFVFFLRQAMTVAAILAVLKELHERELEMIYIAEHSHWRVGKGLTKEDLWKIQDQDGPTDHTWTNNFKLQFRYVLFVGAKLQNIGPTKT